MVPLFKDLKARLAQDPEVDEERVQRAYDMAERVHRGQKRKSGEPFITHPVEVANIIYDIAGSAEDMLCAALLHDVLEDGENHETLSDEIEREFGPDVHFMVEAVSKDCRLLDKDEQQEEYFEQIREALYLDISVFFLKMADLIHNMKTIDSLSSAKKHRWISELKDTYVPMMQNHFHRIATPYRESYLHLLDEIESVIDSQSREQALA